MDTKGLSEHDQLFFKDGYLLGKKAAKEVKNEKAFLACIEEMHLAVDELIDSLLAMAAKQGVAVACQKGCAWCCHQSVFANSYEVHYLGNFIKNNLDRAAQNQILKLAKEKNKVTSAMTEDEILSYKSPCPVLKDGICSAYKARPMACRIYLSLKLASCVEYYQNPQNTANYPALLDFPLQAGRMMNEGFIDALKEEGIFISEFRLEEGLETILTTGSNL